MTLSTNLQSLLSAESKATFEANLMATFVADAKQRNPDVTSEKMLTQLAKPKYSEAIKAVNTELESLKIVNRKAKGAE